MKKKNTYLLFAAVLAAVILVSFSAGVYLDEKLLGREGVEFRIENLKVSHSSPYEAVYSRTPLTISADVANVGDLSGVGHVRMEVDNELVAENDLPLVVGEKRTFEVEVKAGERAHEIGAHTVRVGDLVETYEVKSFPVKVSVEGFAHPRGVLGRCASGKLGRPSSPLLRVSVTNQGSENMVPFRVVVETPEGAFIKGGVIAQTENAYPSACTRNSLQGETTYYVPINSSPATPSLGEYELSVADYSVQGVWSKKFSYSGSNLEVVRWGPFQFDQKENGYFPTGGKVTVQNGGDLPLSVAGLSISIGGKNLNGTVMGEPFVLPQEEKTFQLEFENRKFVQEGTYAATLKLLKWVKRGETGGVTIGAEATRDIKVE